MELNPQHSYKQQISSLLSEAYACRIHNLKHSSELATSALAISRKINEPSLIAKSLSHLALFTMIMGEYEHSLEMSAEALGLYEELGDEKGIADAKYNIAGVHYKTTNYHLGLINLVDCINTYRKYKDHHNLARSLKSLGTIYEYLGDQKNAVIAYEDSIASAKKVGDLNLRSNVFNPLSGIYLKQGNIKKAADFAKRSIEIKTQTGDIRGLAFAYYGRGKVYLVQKRFAEAEADFFEALRIHKEMGESLGLGMAYYKLALLYMEMGRYNQAKVELGKGLDLTTEYQQWMIKYKCYRLFYQIYKLEGDMLNALKYLELYNKERESVINAQTIKIIENYDLINRMEVVKKEAQLQLEKAEILEKKNIAEQTAVVKQEFLSTMSHEIRTPLNAVITISSLLADRAIPEEQEMISALRFASNSLLMLINDILDFTKLDAGKANLEMWTTNFRLLLDNIKKTYDSLANEKGLQLNLVIGDGVAESYEMDENKITQILGNLITNAIKFTYFGRVDLQVEKTGSLETEDRLRFTVNDTGIGIAQAYLREIFDSFSQPQSVRTRKQGGSGLGLAIVKKLVQLHDSDIHVKSKEGLGSSFYFEINLKRTSSPDKILSKYNDSLEGRSVLLAEDNMINAMVISKLLNNWHLCVETARDGQDAVMKSKQKLFDFILMDIHMPEMDGFQATKAIITDPENANYKTPIFALTADVTAEYQNEYHSYFSGFLRKPIETDKLYDALMSAILL